MVSAEECGCVEPVVEKDAPFRVFGYDSLCADYDMPFRTFTEAVQAFRKCLGFGDVVFITGVSARVRAVLEGV